MTRATTPPGVHPRCCSRSSWPLKVSLTDSMTCRKGLNSGAPSRLQQPDALLGQRMLEVATEVPISVCSGWPATSPGSAAIRRG